MLSLRAKIEKKGKIESARRQQIATLNRFFREYEAVKKGRGMENKVAKTKLQVSSLIPRKGDGSYGRKLEAD